MSKFASEHCASLEKFYLNPREFLLTDGIEIEYNSDLDRHIPLMLPFSWCQTCGCRFNAPVLAQPKDN